MAVEWSTAHWRRLREAPSFTLWMALARAAPVNGATDEDAQASLGAPLHLNPGDASFGG